MNAQGTPPPGGPANPHVTGNEVALDHGHVEGTGGVPDRFENPGLPPHVYRAADVDKKSAKRAERQVVVLFLISVIASLGFLISYFAFPIDKFVFIPFFGHLNVQHTLFGLFLGLSLLGIGLGAVHWAKTLMPDEETIEYRHPMRSTDEARQGVADVLAHGADKSQIKRRPLIKMAGGAALGLFAIPPLVQIVAELGPLEKTGQLRDTFWQKGMRLMRDPEGTPIKASDLSLGTVMHVLPEYIETPLDKLPEQYAPHGGPYNNDQDLSVMERKAKAPVLLMRLKEEDFKVAKVREWGFHGIVAYNKICTHAGCPVGLYEQQTHHLLCPCHQSTFDVTKDCEVIFGPAKRPLPQLKITVDDEGYLIADQGFTVPVGPSHWTKY